MIKTVNKVGIRGDLSHIIKDIYDRPTANVRFIGERLDAFSLDQEQDQEANSHCFYST